MKTFFKALGKEVKEIIQFVKREKNEKKFYKAMMTIEDTVNRCQSWEVRNSYQNFKSQIWKLNH